MKKLFLLTLTLTFTLLLPAQDPVPGRGPVFDDDAVHRVDIFIDPGDLDDVLDPSDETEYPATFVFTRGLTSDTVYNVGFRLRGNTSLFADKKSFKVSFNTFISGQDYEGLEKLNLNGEHNDPSVIRSKVCWDILRDMGNVGSRANHIELYINGEYWGIYINVEHIDEEFVDLRYGNNSGNLYKCLYPADLAYLGPDPDAYKLTAQGRRVYDLKTNTDEDDYTDLAEFITVLNLTSDEDFACEIEKVFHVDDYLRYMAYEVLIGNWDGPLYNKNNFYLYHNDFTGKFEYISYDLDNTLGIDWLGQDWGDRDIYNWSHPDEDRPIYTRFLENPIFREQYTFYMQDILEDAFSMDELEDEILATRQMIGPYVQDDPFYPLDYGFTYQEFQDSYYEALGYPQTDYGLFPFIELRHDSAEDQLENVNITPIISRVAHNSPNAEQDINITARLQDDGEVTGVTLFYAVDGGSYQSTPMYDDGSNGDGTPNDGIYGGVVPALGAAAQVDYYVEATDDTGQTGVRPYCDAYSLQVPDVAVSLYINELMASNDNTIADEFGEYDDWLELHYIGSETYFIGGLFLSDDPAEPNKWSLPDVFVEPGDYLLLWIDDDEQQGEFHASFRLSADGETVGIYNDVTTDYAVIDQVSFPPLDGDQAYGRIPDATGPFDFTDPTPGAMNVALSSVSDAEAARPIHIYPNPTEGLLMLDMSELSGGGLMEVFDQVGHRVWSRQLPPGTAEVLELHPGLPSGMYQVRILDAEQRVYTGRLVVQR